MKPMRVLKAWLSKNPDLGCALVAIVLVLAGILYADLTGKFRMTGYP